MTAPSRWPVAHEDGESCAPAREAEPDPQDGRLEPVRLHSRPRRFAMRVYAFSGGVLIGRRSNSWPHVERAWPGRLVALDGLSAAVAGAFISIPQLFSLRNLPDFLEDGPPEDAIVGGWSMGANEMQEAVTVLEAGARGVRAVFALDPRCSMPIQARVVRTVSGLSLDRIISADFTRRITDRGGVLLTSSAGSLTSRARCQCLWFVAPHTADTRSGLNLAGFQPDEVSMDRCEATLSTATRLEAPTSNHFLLGMDHAWDISRRLRRAAAPRGARAQAWRAAAS